jgi:fructose-1,6-bisphosphatase I
VTARLTLESYASAKAPPPGVAETISAIAKAAAALSKRISRGSLGGNLSATLGTNIQGEAQKQLDVFANDTITDALRSAPVAALLSEEIEAPTVFDAGKPVAVAIDPLDGSSNIEVNAPIGTIFAMLPARADDPAAAFLAPGHRQLAAGHVIYGAQTEFALTLGGGTEFFTLDGDTFVHSGTASVAPQSAEFAVNMSNYRHWDDAVRHFVDDCLDGADGPMATDYNMRWLGAVVGEVHRILRRGGLYLYPADHRASTRSGRLRLVYEANPIAFLIEQAGGAATDGVTRILDLVPQAPHQRSGLIFGSEGEVRRVGEYIARDSNAKPPLFAQRGLFRS